MTNVTNILTSQELYLFINKLFDEQKISKNALDEINCYINNINDQKKLNKLEKNRIIQRRYYEKNKTKMRQKSLDYYYKKKYNKAL